MATIGERNALRVIRESPHGLYLDGEELGEILLPGRYIPPGTAAGDYLLVFIHRDSEDRLVATTEIPTACVGEFASLKVVGVHPQLGAFLDWGLSKDLLLPMREQAQRIEAGDAGKAVVAFIFLDRKTDRIVATTRLERHLDVTPPPYEEGQAVQLLIAGETPLGYKAVVEGAHGGLIYKSTLGSPLTIGQNLTGYVQTVRPDGKLDLSLDPAGYARIRPLTEQILAALQAKGGRLNFNDQSTPEAIRATFGTSKKAFKQALGALYRARKIRLVGDGIESVEAAEG
jgi:predicted RNA-binding protein (virulence factor B family)